MARPALFRAERASVVNALSPTQLAAIGAFLKAGWFRRNGRRIPYLEWTRHGWRCNLQPTRTPDGRRKYPQVDVNRFFPPGHPRVGKQLVHLIWWRYRNGGALIRPDLQISHLHHDSCVLALTQESWEMNQSRIYCHRFGWYKSLPGEDRPRCPHWELPCLGD